MAAYRNRPTQVGALNGSGGSCGRGVVTGVLRVRHPRIDSAREAAPESPWPGFWHEAEEVGSAGAVLNRLVAGTLSVLLRHAPFQRAHPCVVKNAGASVVVCDG